MGETRKQLEDRCWREAMECHPEDVSQWWPHYVAALDRELNDVIDLTDPPPAAQSPSQRSLAR